MEIGRGPSHYQLYRDSAALEQIAAAATEVLTVAILAFGPLRPVGRYGHAASARRN